jgi:hypothetical protein
MGLDEAGEYVVTCEIDTEHAPGSRIGNLPVYQPWRLALGLSGRFIGC